MPRTFELSEATAARRRFPLYLVDATDGITAETGEAGGQPQVSKNGGAWANTTATLTAVGNGAYYVELTAAELDTVGMLIVRYKSANTAEANMDGQVVAFDPYSATNLGLTNLDAAVSSRSSHSAADVWTSATRTLTSFGTLVQDIWDKATSALTVAGSIGKLLVDNVNATISSRSSHAAADIWAVGTRTLTSFGTLVSDIWAAVVDSAGVTTLLSRLSATRAGYLDNLSAGAVALAADLTTLTNRVGAFTGSGVNTILGFFKALAKKDASNPSDLGGTYDAATDSQEALSEALVVVDDFLDSEVAAIKAKTDNLPASPAAVGSAMTLTSGERNSVADALLDRADAIETGLTPRQAHRLEAAAAAGKLSGAATATVAIRNAVADSKARITATVDADGNRSAVTTDVT